MKAQFSVLAVTSVAALTLTLSACSGSPAPSTEGSATPQAADNSSMAEGTPMGTDPQSDSSPAAQGTDAGGTDNAQPSSEFDGKLLVGEHAGITLNAVPHLTDFGAVQEGAEVEPAECNAKDLPKTKAASAGVGAVLVGSVTLADNSFAPAFKEHVMKCPTVTATAGGITVQQTQEVAEVTVEGVEGAYAVKHVTESTLGEEKIAQQSYYIAGVVSDTSVVILVTGLDGSSPPDPEVAKELFEKQRALLGA
ncbi:MAG: hypothetical protein Q4D96_04275 [Propionibacteriaceae bacterium]|nr:hypothetical protein [Propionibacteriaceae bacterium]